MSLEDKYKLYVKKKEQAEKRRNQLEAEMKAYEKQYAEKKQALLDEFGLDSIDAVKAKIAADREALKKEKAEKEAELDKYLAD